MRTKPNSLLIPWTASARDFIHKYFGVEWPDRAVYHAMINTAIGDDAVVHMILDFMKTVDASVPDLAQS